MSNTIKQTYDIVIVGNGILGMSLAYQLKKKDKNLRVAIIGPVMRPHAATTAAGAMINVWAEIAPGQFENPAMAERAQLGINAFDMWNPLCEELSDYGHDRVQVKWGTYVINNALGTKIEDRALDYVVEAMQRHSVPHATCSAADIPWYAPELKARALHIIRLPDGRIDPRLVLTLYDKATDVLGVDIFRDEASRLLLGKNGEVHTVALKAGGEVQGKNMVLANGSYAQNLIDPLPELRKEIPRLLWGGGAAVDIIFPDWVQRRSGPDRNIFDMDAVLRTVDRGGACGLHVVPYGDGKFYLGASSGVWIEPEEYPRVHAIHFLLRSLIEEVSTAFFFATMKQRELGFRPVTIDAFPLLGETHINGIWLANGMKRDGFTCSPFLAQEMAAAILGQPHKLPACFTPCRKLISYKTEAAAIEDAVNAHIGGEMMHGLALTPYTADRYRQAKLLMLKKLYEKRGITDFGIHPEVTHLYDNDDVFAMIDHPREKPALNKKAA